MQQVSNKQASGRTPNLLKLAVPGFGSYRYPHMRDPFTALQYSSVERRAVPLVYSSELVTLPTADDAHHGNVLISAFFKSLSRSAPH